MKKTGLLILLALISATAFAGSRKAICISGGPSMEGDLTASVSYLHPMLVNQLYFTAGLAYVDVSYDPTFAVPAGGEPYQVSSFSFTGLRQLNFGLRLGDHLFVAPKVSYNWYGSRNSVGWGFAVGFVLHPTELFSFGFSGAIDQPRISPKNETPWAPDVVSLSAIIQLVMAD